MAEVLSAYETAKSCIQVAQTIYTYLAKVKHAPKERQQYLDEVRIVLGTLNFLQGRLDEARKGNSWSRALLTLVEPGKRFVPDKTPSENDSRQGTLGRGGRCVPKEKKPEPKGTYYYDADSYVDGGILRHLKGLLVDLSENLKPRTGLRDVGDRVGWYWKDSGVKDQMGNVVRLRGHIDSLLRQDEHDLSLTIQIVGQDTNERIKDVQETQKREAREKERREIMVWLSPLEFYEKQEAVFTDKFPTGQWLLDSPEFKAWVMGRKWILWCYGDPGAGKTVLCSNIIHHLENQGPKRSIVVLYLYLDYKEKEKQTLVNLIGSLVKQLIQHQQFEFRSNRLRLKYLASRGEAKPKKEEMIVVLQDEFKAYSRVYLVVDGWNDAPDYIQADLEYLLLKDLFTDNVSTMITSRSAESDSATKTVTCDVCGASKLSIYFRCKDCGLRELCQSCKDQEHSYSNPTHKIEEPYDRVHLRVLATDNEIRKYVEWEMERQTKYDHIRRIDPSIGATSLSTTPLSRRLEAKPSLRQQIPDKIVRNAKGMYLLARLYIDSLKTMQNVKQIETALLTMPEDLDAVYKEKMERIVSQRRKRFADWGKEALYWIVCTYRPLSLVELTHALAVKAGNTTYDPDEETREADIISATAGLVTVDFDKQAVRIHVTLHSYLQEHREQWFPGAEADISLTILTYLNFEDLDQPCRNDSCADIAARLEHLPLLSYASQYWGDHVTKVCSKPEIRSVLLEFVSNTGKLDSCLQAAFYTDMKIYTDLDAREGVNGLHLSALYGFDSVIPNLILEKGIGVDSVDPKYRQTAMMYACRKGHLTIVSQLLDFGAAINLRSARESTAYFEAYLREGEVYMDIAKLLLKRKDLKVNVAFVDEMNRTALMMAACFGDAEIVRLLLHQPDIETDLQDQEGYTALALAVLENRANIVELLLGHPDVNINLRNIVGTSPLTIAARNGNADLVNQLLDKGADTSIHDKEGGGTALLRAVDAGHSTVVQCFMDHNIDIQIVDDRARSLLHGASINGHEEVVRLLLKAGLPTDAIGDRGETPLHDASRGGHYAVAVALLEAGADRMVKDKFGRTPAEVAWHHGHINIMRLLKGKSTDIETSSGEPVPNVEKLPTWSLAKLGLLDLLRQRITQGSTVLSDTDPDTNNTALHCAVMDREHETLELLLEAKLSPNCGNDYGRTPLHLAASQDDMESTRILLRYRPRLGIRDLWDMTPLVIAQNRQHYSIAVALLDAGAQLDDAHRADMHATFFAAIELGNTKVVEKLIVKGADHMRPNLDGITAKQIARAKDDTEMLRILDEQEGEFSAFKFETQRVIEKTAMMM